MQSKYVDHMGTDLSVVNAARVSFSKESALVDGKLSKGDTSLIQFLARGCTSGDWNGMVSGLMRLNAYDDFEIEDLMKYIKNMPTHWTPFGHTAITLHMKAPLFVARQLGKHQVGLVWNEVSRRYVSDEPEFYTPEVWRKAAANVKQGSSDEAVEWICGESGEQIRDLPRIAGSSGKVQSSVKELNRRVRELYVELLASGVCPEQARMVLPQSMYTEWYWTGNLYAFANVFIQRTDSHAQKETQEIAHQIGSIISPLFPVSWKALTQ
jgi:thymidylate synthase (FAD)